MPRIADRRRRRATWRRRVMGQELALPVMISPTGVQAVHPEGEVAVARAAAARAARRWGSARSPASRSRRWSRPTRRRSSRSTGAATRERIDAAARAGPRRRRGGPDRHARLDLRPPPRLGQPGDPRAARPGGDGCAGAARRCVRPALAAAYLRRGRACPTWRCRTWRSRRRAAPTFFGAYGEWMMTPPPSWDDLAWLREQWGGPVHGQGRDRVPTTPAARSRSAPARSRSRTTAATTSTARRPRSARCPAVVDAVGGEIEVLLDGGVRRGSDVVKALALGARAVMIGRAYLWGLAADGEAGVENVLEILRAGIDETLIGLGRASIAELVPEDVLMSGGVHAALSGERRDSPRLTWPEVERASASAADSLLVPLGATEQHGPHLPLGTDTDIAVALAEAPPPSARRTWSSRPALAYGSSGEHAGFAGHPLDRRGRDRARSWSSSAARRPRPSTASLFVCAHGGNAAPLARRGRAAARGGPRRPRLVPALRRRRPRRSHRDLADARASAPEPAPGEPRPASDAAAGRADAAAAGRRRARGRANGVLGDPTGASAEEGRALLAAAIADGGTLDAWRGARGAPRERRRVVTGAGARDRRRDGGGARRRRLARSSRSTAAPTIPGCRTPLATRAELEAVVAAHGRRGRAGPRAVADAADAAAMAAVVARAEEWRRGRCDRRRRRRDRRRRAAVGDARRRGGRGPRGQPRAADGRRAGSAIPALLAGPQPRAGRFIAIASAAATRGLPMLAAYCAAKAGVSGSSARSAPTCAAPGSPPTRSAPGSTRDRDPRRERPALRARGRRGVRRPAADRAADRARRDRRDDRLAPAPAAPP